MIKNLGMRQLVFLILALFGIAIYLLIRTSRAPSIVVNETLNTPAVSEQNETQNPSDTVVNKTTPLQPL